MTGRRPRIERKGEDEDCEVTPQGVASSHNRSEGVDVSGVARRALCLRCVRCDRSLEPIYPESAQDEAKLNSTPPRAQPANATVFYGMPGYGSDHDLHDVGIRLAINLCDGCLAAVASRGAVNSVREKRMTQLDYHRWEPGT